MPNITSPRKTLSRKATKPRKLSVSPRIAPTTPATKPMYDRARGEARSAEQARSAIMLQQQRLMASLQGHAMVEPEAAGEGHAEEPPETPDRDYPPGFTPKSQFRKATKPLKPIDLSKAKNPTELKTMRNTLAARKTRSRREAREHSMEATIARLRNENQFAKAVFDRAMLLLPSEGHLEPSHGSQEQE